MNHTHTQTKTKTMPDHLASQSSNTHKRAVSKGLKYAQLSVSPRQHLSLTEQALTQAGRHTGGLGLASATELVTDGPHCGKTLTFQKRMVFV